MTAKEFRNLALSLPRAVEQSHMDHPDFRVGGKIFATLGYPNSKCGMVKLKPKQQAEMIAQHDGIFEKIKGGWGDRGATRIQLPAANEEIVRRALILAWKNTAPRSIAKELTEE